jgi:ArsR family transcriptional regulator
MAIFAYTRTKENSMRKGNGYREQARVFRILANESRLAIVDLLRRREHNVGEIVEHLSLDQSTVSKHLAMLRGAGLVEDRRVGNRVVYALTLPCVLEVCSCVERVLKERR